MKRRIGLAALFVLAAACTSPNGTSERHGASANPIAADVGALALRPSPAPTAAPLPSSSAAPALPRCSAPLLTLDADIDAHDAASIAHCVHLPRGTGSCGAHATSVDAARFRASVLPLDDATTSRVVRIATAGKAAGMNPHAFGLVGDSITASGSFLRGYGKTMPAVTPDADVAALLALPDGGSIIDYYRGADVEHFAGQPLDSFEAERAAKVGARVTFALEGGKLSPAESLVDHVKPAIAVVAFGANDAAYRIADPNELADAFEKDLLVLVDRLEARGVVVVLETEMRHGDAPGIPACPTDAAMNDWRIAVTTNAIVRRTAEVACREHLPLVDLRYAIDTATAHGLGPDATHLSNDARRGVHLDARALDCGYPIREVVTLMALRDLVALFREKGVFP